MWLQLTGITKKTENFNTYNTKLRSIFFVKRAIRETTYITASNYFNILTMH